jgi:hypothetical protein
VKGFLSPLAVAACWLVTLSACTEAYARNPILLSAAFYSLKAATLESFDVYVAKAEATNATTLKDGPFLWVDSLPTDERTVALAKLRAGEVETRRRGVRDGDKSLDVPGGLIHDWEGMVFIPGVKLDDVLKILKDYNHQSIYYAPEVTQSRIESQQGNQYRVFLQFRRRKIVTVVLNTEHEVTYYCDSPVRAHSRSSAIRISQVEDPGGPHEKEKTPADDDGFLWRMETWWRLEERNGGVYVQNEVVSLTRDIPTGLGWLIEPFITKIPEETLQFTLNATRKAVLTQKEAQNGVSN